MKVALILALIAALLPPERQRDEPERKVLDRYAVIAEAVWSVSDGDRELAAYLLTIIRFESAFWRSVHSGKLGGDCIYDDKRRPVPGTCRSWCLVQINIGRGSSKGRSLFTKYTREQLVGLGAASTRRCVETGAAYVTFARNRCGDNRPRCVFNAYGGVGANADEETRRQIRRRVATYRTLRGKLEPTPRPAPTTPAASRSAPAAR